MDVRRSGNTPGEFEREHLAQDHHDICTALTVLRCNVELVRIELREAQLERGVVPVHAHLDELDGAVDRLHAIAREMKQRHDGIAPPSGAVTKRAPGEQANPSVSPPA